MESAKCLVAAENFRQKYHSDAAGGTRALLLLGSSASLPSEDVVPRQSVILSDEERNTLANGLALPQNRWTDRDVILARYAQDADVSIGAEASFTGSEEVSCESILAKLKDFLKSSTDKDGAIVHYFGNGKRNTGDWCFSDGFITFQDLMDVYMETYRGRVLTIVSDCSHSGTWVKQSYEFMDGQGIPPCGHHAVEKGVLIKILTSCKPSQRASVLGYSLHCMFYDKNSGCNKHSLSQVIRKMHTSYGRDFTAMLCGNTIDEKCLVDPSMTWHQKLLAGRVYLVRGKDRGRPAWHYVLLVDDEETIDAFKATAKTGNVDVANYGEILFSGFGEDPPNEITERVHKKYKVR